MNITTQMIITDTNIITDLDVAEILDEYISLDNVYISDMIKNDEINSKTGNVPLINKFKVVDSSINQLMNVIELQQHEHKLSMMDLLNYVIAKDKNFIIATGDNKLKEYCEHNNIKVIRTLYIIKEMKETNVISKIKHLELVNY